VYSLNNPATKYSLEINTKEATIIMTVMGNEPIRNENVLTKYCIGTS
jgi:hypothetical protein